MEAERQTAAIVRAEIERFHAALVGWFAGRIPAGRFEAELSGALHPDFTWVAPSGRVLTRAALAEGLREGHGRNPDFRIAIEETELIAAGDGLIVASYVERQTGARNAPPANIRRSTVVFVPGPRGLLWRYLHETWQDPGG